MNDLSIWNQFIRRPGWFDAAACRDLPPAMFFTNGNDCRSDTGDQEKAKQVCAGCPVRMDCLAFGLEERHGIWGGRTPRERRLIRRVSRSSVA